MLKIEVPFFWTFLEICRQSAGLGRVKSGCSIVLNDSASHKIVIKIYIFFF